MNGKEQQMMLWQSDYPIVLKKSLNRDREKGVAGTRRDGRDTTARHRAGARLSTKLSSLTKRAAERPKYKFMTLMQYFTEDFLRECFRELKRDKAPGIDGVTVAQYEVGVEENLKDLLMRLRTWNYRPKPVRRVYIPKADGTKRGLGIPAIEDKIVQLGMKKILEAIFEADFLDVSYGFRPKRSCHDALEVVDKTIMTKPINYVVDMDIAKFFDTVDHRWLKNCLRQRIVDKNFLRLIARFLRAGIMEEGEHIETDKGTPQGGVLSPLLANVYLHYVLDLWFEKVCKKQFKGYVRLVRYADDFVICFQSGSEAEKFSKMLRQRLDKFGLKAAEEKSRIIEFGRSVWQKAQQKKEQVATFDFLGFTHYCDKTRGGKFKLGRKTSRKRMWQKVKAINEWLRAIRNTVKLEEWWQMLGKKLAGHYRYYGISGNMPSLRRFYNQTSRLAYKWLNRRSQKKSYTFDSYIRYLKFNPLPEPKIYHATYTLSSSKDVFLKSRVREIFTHGSVREVASVFYG